MLLSIIYLSTISSIYHVSISLLPIYLQFNYPSSVSLIHLCISDICQSIIYSLSLYLYQSSIFHYPSFPFLFLLFFLLFFLLVPFLSLISAAVSLSLEHGTFLFSAASHRQKFKLLPAITPGKSLRTVQLKRHVSKVGSVRTERSFACLCALLYLTIQIHRIPP